MHAVDKFLVFLSSLAIIGTALFYAFRFDPFVALAAALVATLIILRELPRTKWIGRIRGEFSWWSVAYEVLWVILIVIAWKSRTDEAFFSPFQALPWYFLPLYLLATIILISRISAPVRSVRSLLFPISLHLFLSLAIASLVYRLGYGFDPFIHQATEKLLSLTGTISPKPLYYIGHYVLVLCASAVTGIAHTAIDTWIVPVAAAIFVPYYLVRGIMSRYALGSASAGLSALSLLLMPFGVLINSTPQSLANIFLIVVIAYSLIPNRSRILQWLVALAILAIHPIAGIPALLFVTLDTIPPDFRKLKLFGSVAAFAAFPLALAVAGWANLIPLSFAAPSFPDIFSGVRAMPTTFPLDITYLYSALIPGVLMLLAALGAARLYRHKELSPAFPNIVLFFAMLFNAWIFTSSIRFMNTAPDEYALYGERFVILAWYFSIPLLCNGVAELIQRSRGTVSRRLFGALFFAGAITATLYASYPRFDEYEQSSFINLSRNDVAAVREIEARATRPYAVLANQMISAAALKEFGFGRTLPGDPRQFFYPIPTGGAFYGYYDRMVTDEPTRLPVMQAMDYAKVEQIYVALPSYWERYDIISEQLKSIADESFMVGPIAVFLFQK